MFRAQFYSDTNFRLFYDTVRDAWPDARIVPEPALRLVLLDPGLFEVHEQDLIELVSDFSGEMLPYGGF